MSVTITWKISDSLVTETDHGSGGSGTDLTAKTIFIEHDGDNQLTNCKLWLGEKTASYAGDFDSATDLAELIEWGDGPDSDAFGGFLVNMNAAGSFSSASWPTYDDKNGSNYSAFYTGHGDSVDNGVLLSEDMNSTPSMPNPGVIPANCSVWPSFQCKIRIPTDETTLGAREFTQKLTFTYTS